MQSAEQLLAALQQRDIQLSVNAGKLRCNAPKGAMTEALRDSIKQYKPQLLQLLSQANAPTTQTLPTIARDGELPLSFSQQRIWLLSHLDPANHFTGNLHFHFDIQGALNIPALEQAINALIQRHEVLRTVCHTVNGQPQQHIEAAVAFKLPVRDLRNLDVAEQTRQTQQYIEQCIVEPFDLSQAPLLRAEVLQLGTQEFLFQLTTHVYVFDGWSTAILLRELSAFYAAYQQQQSPQLEPLAAQYVDFAHWHRQWFNPQEVAKQRQYWLQTLQDTHVVSLSNASCQADESVHSEQLSFSLPDFLNKAVRELAQHNGVTLFIALLAAYQCLLYSYTRQAKLAVGSIVSNRRLTETEALIGSFANNILLPADFSAPLSFAELLQQVAKTARSAYAQQDLPFESLLGELPSQLQQQPLFRYMFVLHQHQSQAAQAQGLQLDGLQVNKRSDVRALSKYDIELVMVERDGQLSGQFEYNAKLFSAQTMTQINQHFLQLLGQLSQQAQAPLQTLLQFELPQDTQANTAAAQTPSYNAPRTATEQAIAQIWCDLLALETVDIHTRFNELGGHSLLAIRLLQQLQEKHGLQLPLSAISALPTIAELAQHLEAQA